MNKYRWIGIVSMIALLLITGCAGQEEVASEVVVEAPAEQVPVEEAPAEQAPPESPTEQAPAEAVPAEISGQGGSGNSAGSGGTGGSGSSDYEIEYLNEDYEDAMPVMMQLTLGTMMLKDTDYPITAEQAAALLPLWQMLRGLTESGTAAQAEFEAVINQIVNTMTVEQMNAIAVMEIQRDDMLTVMEQVGITPPGSVGGSGSGGGMGGSMSGGGELGNASPEQVATMQARRANTGFGGNPALFDAVIEMLQGITGS